MAFDIFDERVKIEHNCLIRNIGYCPQFDSIIPELTGRELLTLMCRVGVLFILKVTVDVIFQLKTGMSDSKRYPLALSLSCNEKNNVFFPT